MAKPMLTDFLGPREWKSFDPNNPDWNLGNVYPLSRALREYKGNVPPEILKKHGITPADPAQAPSPLENIPKHVNDRAFYMDLANLTHEQMVQKYGPDYQRR